MPLTMANAGQEWKVVSVNSPHDMRMRLTNLGLTSGIAVRVISRNPSSLLVGIRDTRIMLNYGIA